MVANLIKIILLGPCGTGKTSVAQRLCSDTFSKASYSPTIGFHMYQFVLQLNNQDESSATLNIWDLSGECLKSRMLSYYVYGADGIIFLYDVTNRETFQVLSSWIEKTRNLNKKYGQNPKMSIVGNKVDLSHKRVIKQDDHDLLLVEQGMPGFLISARSKESIYAPFVSITSRCLKVDLSKTETLDIPEGIVKVIIPNEEHNEADDEIVESNKRNICDIQ